jgi:hypothetical protein
MSLPCTQHAKCDWSQFKLNPKWTSPNDFQTLHPIFPSPGNQSLLPLHPLVTTFLRSPFVDCGLCNCAAGFLDFAQSSPPLDHRTRHRSTTRSTTTAAYNNRGLCLRPTQSLRSPSSALQLRQRNDIRHLSTHKLTLGPLPLPRFTLHTLRHLKDRRLQRWRHLAGYHHHRPRA